MSDFKPCKYCKNASGFNCQQCYNNKLWELDEEKEFENKDFENEVRADAFEEFVRLYKVFQDIPCNKDVFPISCDGMCIDCFEKWVKEQNNE